MKIRIAFAMLAIYLVWGSTYIGIHFAVETIPPFLMAGTRYLVPGIILILWRRLAGDPPPTRRQWFACAIVGILLLLGGNGLLSWAVTRLQTGVAALLIGTVPIWMVLIDAALAHKQPRWPVIVGLLAGFGGIILLIGPDSLIGGHPQYDLLGMGIALLAALFWSIGSVYSRNADLPSSALMGTGIEMVAGSFGLYIASLASGEWAKFSIVDISQHSLFGLLYLILFGTLIGFVAYNWLLRNAPIELVSTYAYVNPLVAILLGTWLAQELLTWHIALSAAIIIGSVVLINSFKKNPEISPTD